MIDSCGTVHWLPEHWLNFSQVIDEYRKLAIVTYLISAKSGGKLQMISRGTNSSPLQNFQEKIVHDSHYKSQGKLLKANILLIKPYHLRV